jgi:DNA-binding CsgD family transcriptional regulator/tetratricopeptide (TPR) repeat protein
MTERFETSRPNHFEPLTSCVSSHAPIVGRQHELTLLMNQYKAVREGRARVVLFAGEPGIGKTRLLNEVALQTAREGATVLYGNASEDEGMPPFLPFLEAIGRYIRATPQDQLRRQLSAIPQTLASLLPELAIYLPDLLSLPVPPEQARLRLYEAIGTFLGAICEEHALVLILDNLHWADSASLDLLCHLVHYQAHTQLFILGAYREGDVDRNPSLAHTIAELSHQRVLSTVAISPLSEVEVGLLALGRHGSPLSPGVNTLLHVESEGNPFFAEELLDGWIESGTLTLQNQQWVAMAPLVDTLPSTIAGALRQRFAHLAPVVIDHLRVAAVIGRSFELALLATVEEQEGEAVEECLLEAVQARLIQIDKQGYYFFSHDKIRECLYIEVSTSRRRRLHSLIGHVLETQAGQEHTLSVYQLADLAFHFARSGDQTRGVHYSLLAATQSLQTTAIEKAMSHYSVALALLSHNDRRRGDILLNQGEVALLAGNNQEAETVYETAKNWFLQSNKQDDAVYIGRATHGLGLSLWRQEKRQEAYEALEHALAFFGSRECVEKVKILLDLSQLLMIYMGKQDEGLAYAQRALEMARNLGETALETTARRVTVENLSIHGYDLPVAVQFLETVLAQTEERGDLTEASECCLNLAVAYYWLGEIKRSYEVSLHRITLIERSRQHYQLLTAYTWPVVLLASQGKWTEAKREIEKARHVVESSTSSMHYAFLHQFQGFLAYQQEQYILAECELQTATALVKQNFQSGLGEIMFYIGLHSLIEATLGKREEASASLASLEHLLNVMPDGILPTAPMRLCLALSTISLGDYEHAKSLYTHLFAFRGQHYWFLVDRVLGLLAILNRDWEAATTHLAEAEVIARREGLHPELARTLVGQADVALGRGGKESAQQAMHLLNEARLLFETLEMEDSVHHARHQLEALSHRHHDTVHSSLPAGLTPREVEVLKLVTRGRRNSQIARELVISEKTVINHLTHIFNKTNSENRAAATAFAVHHGLA